MKIRKSYFILTVAAFIFAIFSGGNLPFSIFYCLLLILIVSGIYSRSVKKNLSIYVKCDNNELIAGQENNIIIEANNDSIFPMPYVEIKNSLISEVLDKYRGDTVSININSRKFIKKKINFLIRGEYKFGSTTCVVSDIFGIFTWKELYKQRGNIKVYPKIYPLKNIVINGANLKEYSIKNRKELNRGSESLETIKNIREYKVGDSYRRINWKVTAKHGKLFVKEYESSESPRIHVFLDLREEAFKNVKSGEKEEETVEFFLSLVNYMQQKNINCQAIIIGEKIREFKIKNSYQFEGLKEHMVSKYSSGKGSLPNFMKKSLYEVNKKSAVVIVTYDTSKDNVQYFIELSREGYEITLFYLGKVASIDEGNIIKMINHGVCCYNIEEIR